VDLVIMSDAMGDTEDTALENVAEVYPAGVLTTPEELLRG
jgi:hypothetical protein